MKDSETEELPGFSENGQRQTSSSCHEGETAWGASSAMRGGEDVRKKGGGEEVLRRELCWGKKILQKITLTLGRR